jgi:hypothetical protein
VRKKFNDVNTSFLALAYEFYLILALIVYFNVGNISPDILVRHLIFIKYTKMIGSF